MDNSAKAPFYKVILIGKTERDLTPYIDSFRFEDGVEEDDMIEVRFSSLGANQVADDKDLVTGAIIKYQFGFLGGRVTSFREVRLTDITVRYADTISLTLRALDKGTVMKKQTSNKVWKNVTTRTIVNTIAQSYGLKGDCKIVGKTWDSLPQGHLSDFEFLQQIASKEAEGEYICYVKDKSLVFEKRGIEKQSTKTYVYGDGNGRVISFEPKTQESTAKKTGVAAKTVAFDPKAKKAVVGSGERNDGAMLDESPNLYNSSANRVGTKDDIDTPSKTKDDGIFGKVQSLGGTIVSPPHDKKTLDDKAKKEAKDGGLDQETATLRIEGDPDRQANEVITMAGVFKRHLGNWLIKKVTHDISSGGYTSTLELAKNATKLDSGLGNENKAKGTVNKSVGSKEGEQKRKNLYNSSAERVS